MAEIKFKCKSCGNDQLEEVMVNVTVISPIVTLWDADGLGDCEYETSLNEYGEVDRFQCSQCGEVIDGATTLEELVAILKEQV